MNHILVVPLKRTSDVDITRPLKTWINSTFSSNERPQDLSNALTELQKLRQKSVKSNDLNESGLTTIGSYYDQLVSLESKIPSSEVNFPFKWRDAFDRGGIFSGRMSLSIPTIAFEKVCVLFNIAALNSITAAEQNLSSSEGLQKCLKKLQLSAGIFSHLKETVVATLQQDPTPDMEPDTLQVLSDLMVAQAQEMVVLKAIMDNMKDQIVAKLCASCEELFAAAMRNMQKDSLRGMWDNDWLPTISGKQALYHGLSQFFQSKVCKSNKAVGEEIARLQFAQKLIQTSIDRSRNPELGSANDWLRKTEKPLADAKKDNDFIYHERIPEEKSLASVGKAIVAKATPMPPKLGSDVDLFENLVPLAIHQALASYSTKKSTLVTNEIQKMKDATNVLNATLSSLNLPAALEDTSGNELPQSLKDKAAAIVANGGVANLSKMIAELPDALQRNKEILDEADRILKEEKDSDDQLRSQFGGKWNRIESEKLTSTFRTNSEKYRTILNNATSADDIVREKFERHRHAMETLSKGANEMQQNLPASGGVKGSPTVSKLKALMEDVETLKAERQVIESEFKAVNVDMKPAFFESLNKEGRVNENNIIIDSLANSFGSLQKQVNDNLARQEKLLVDVRSEHVKFVGESGVDGKSAREEILKQWAAAHDAYFEINGNLQEGTKFYNDLTQLLVTFQNKVSDFCFARRTEKEELLKDLTSGLSRMNLDSSPSAPAHHNPASAGSVSPQPPTRKIDPPARPPPPNTTSTTPAPNPYAGAPATAPQLQQPAPNPYGGAPSNPHLPYSPAGGIPMPYQPYPYPQMPGYQPYPTGYQVPPAYPGYAPYPPQPGYPAYPPQGVPPGGQPPPPPPPQYYPPQGGQPWS